MYNQFTVQCGVQCNVGLYKYANPPPSIIWSTSPFETVNRGHTNKSLMAIMMMMTFHQNRWLCSEAENAVWIGTLFLLKISIVSLPLLVEEASLVKYTTMWSTAPFREGKFTKVGCADKFTEVKVAWCLGWQKNIGGHCRSYCPPSRNPRLCLLALQCGLGHTRERWEKRSEVKQEVLSKKTFARFHLHEQAYAGSDKMIFVKITV